MSESNNIIPQPEPSIESWLAQRGARIVELRFVETDAIDEAASLANQARDNAIAPATVDKYAEHMRNGAVFPPIVLRRNGEQLVVINGNHRAQAARRAGVQVAAYVVECSDEQALAMTLTANETNGLSLSDAERRARVERLQTVYTAEQIALELGIPRGRVSTIIGANRMIRRLREAGASDLADKLPESTLHALSRLDSDLAETALTAFSIPGANVGPTAVAKLASEAGKLESHAERVALVNEWVRDVAHKASSKLAGTKSGPKPEAALAAAVRKVAREARKLSRTAHLVDPEALKQLSRELDDVAGLVLTLSVRDEAA